jgi:hypothetical protein
MHTEHLCGLLVSQALPLYKVSHFSFPPEQSFAGHLDRLNTAPLQIRLQSMFRHPYLPGNLYPFIAEAVQPMNCFEMMVDWRFSTHGKLLFWLAG